MRYCPCDTGEPHPVSECVVPGQANDEVFAEDVRAIAVALGLGDHARPYSAHAVVHRELLPALRSLPLPECRGLPMTAPSPVGLSPLLDQLDEVREAALAIRSAYPSLPVLRQKGADVEAVWSDGADMTWIECEEEAYAALIVAAVNASPVLTAVIRAVEALAEELQRFGSDRDRDNEEDDEAMAASAAAYLRSAHLILTTLTAALTPGADTADTHNHQNGEQS